MGMSGIKTIRQQHRRRLDWRIQNQMNSKATDDDITGDITNDKDGPQSPSPFHRPSRDEPTNESERPLRFDPARSGFAISFGQDDGDFFEQDEDEDTVVEDERGQKQRDRMAKIKQLMQEQDEQFRLERKQATWGDYANVTSADEVAQVAAKQAEKAEQGT